MCATLYFDFCTPYSVLTTKSLFPSVIIRLILFTHFALLPPFPFWQARLCSLSLPVCYFLVYLFGFIYLFDHTERHVGSQFHDQGSNLEPLALNARSLNHWTIREVPVLFYFVCLFYLGFADVKVQSAVNQIILHHFYLQSSYAFHACVCELGICRML